MVTLTDSRLLLSKTSRFFPRWQATHFNPRSGSAAAIGVARNKILSKAQVVDLTACPNIIPPCMVPAGVTQCLFGLDQRLVARGKSKKLSVWHAQSLSTPLRMPFAWQ